MSHRVDRNCGRAVRSEAASSVAAAAAALVCATCLTGAAGAQRPEPPLDEPIRERDALIFPEGANIPRFLTNTEAEFLRDFPLLLQEARGATPPPVGPLRAVAEYEPMDGILIAYENYPTILGQMAARITADGPTGGGANVYVMCDDATEASTAASALIGAGANPARVFTFIVQTDTVWIRDYGPRYVYEGDVRVIVDHTYNRPRPFDDAQPFFWSATKKHALYEIPLIHGGGNYHLNALGASHATRLINNENPTLTEQQIHDLWMNYQACDTTFYTPFATSVDATQHIDMWMQVIADDKVIISDWPAASGSAHDQICDNAAAALAGAGYTVHRVPAVTVSGVHYTFTNVVMCNNLVLVPSYTNATASTYNAQALSAWQNALPGKSIQQINCQGMIAAAGAMHCIVMHVPAHKGAAGGVNPTAYLRTLRGGESLTPGQVVNISWIADDDQAVTSATIRLSTDSGATYPFIIASNLAMTSANPSYNWTVPAGIDTAHGRIRVVVRDAVNNTGSDESDSDIVIGNPAPPCGAGDVNCDGSVDVDDLIAVILAWGPCSNCAACPADIAPPPPNGNCAVDVDDLIAVILNWG